VTILFGFQLTLIARFIVSWLKSQAGTTDTRWDDIVIAAIGKPSSESFLKLHVMSLIKRNTCYLIIHPRYFSLNLVIRA